MPEPPQVARYYRNRVSHSGPIEHKCIRCGIEVHCDKQPCYVPPVAPFYMCPPCIEASADEFARLLAQNATLRATLECIAGQACLSGPPDEQTGWRACHCPVCDARAALAEPPPEGHDA